MGQGDLGTAGMGGYKVRSCRRWHHHTTYDLHPGSLFLRPAPMTVEKNPPGLMMPQVYLLVCGCFPNVYAMPGGRLRYWPAGNSTILRPTAVGRIYCAPRLHARPTILQNSFDTPIRFVYTRANIFLSVHFLLSEQFRRTPMKPASPPTFVTLAPQINLPAYSRFLARPQLLTLV
jgi:hypothetical protein